MAQDPVHDRRKRLWQAGLHHEPVAPGLAGFPALVLEGAPCQDDHRQGAGFRLSLEHSRQAKPIHITWQADGGDHHVRTQLGSHSETVATRGCLERAVPLELEPLGVHLALIT